MVMKMAENFSPKHGRKRIVDLLYKVNRPKLTLSGLYLSPNDVQIYTGTNVGWNNTQPITDEHINLVLNPKYLRKETLLDHNGKNYIFINRYPRYSEEDIDNVVLAFDVLNLKIDFGNSNQICKLRMSKAYSMMSGIDSFGNDMKLNIDIPIDKPSLEIPIAYAFLNSRKTLMNLHGINKLAKSGIKKTIDFLNSGITARKYLNFVENAYLLECITSDNDVYYYTLLLKINDNKTFNSSKIYNGTG